MSFKKLPASITDRFDPKHQQNTIILKHCLNHHYYKNLTIKILKNPTNTEFANMATFLLKTIDPHFSKIGNFYDNFINTMIYLDYEQTISKQLLIAVGAPHTWSKLLAALVWLCELVKYNECVVESFLRQNEPTNLDLSASSSSLLVFFQKFLEESYAAFLAGEDHIIFQLKARFLSTFENAAALMSDKIDTCNAMNAAMMVTIDELTARSAYLSALEARRVEAGAMYSISQVIVDEQQRSLCELRDEVNTTRDQLDDLQASVDEVNDRNNALTAKIRSQELSPNDVRNMIDERSRLERSLAATRVSHLATKQEAGELDLTLREKATDTEELIRAYHSVAEELKLVPQSAHNAHGRDLSLQVDQQARKLKTDVRADILPALQSVLMCLSERSLALRSDLLAEQDAAEEVRGRWDEILVIDTEHKRRLVHLEATFKREEEALDRKMTAHANELQTLERRLAELQDNAVEEAHIQHCTRRLSETAALRAVRRCEHERKKDSMLASIADIASQCAAHKENVQTQLETVKEREKLSPVLLDLLMTASPLSLVDTNCQHVC